MIAPVDHLPRGGQQQRREREQQHHGLRVRGGAAEGLLLAIPPAHHHRGAEDEEDVADDRSDYRGLDDFLQPLEQREERDDQLGRVPERHVQQAPDPRARSRRQVLRGLAHERRRRDDPQRGGAEDEHRRGVRQLERYGDRDEDPEEVDRPHGLGT
jgi:hypothetical protein